MLFNQLCVRTVSPKGHQRNWYWKLFLQNPTAERERRGEESEWKRGREKREGGRGKEREGREGGRKEKKRSQRGFLETARDEIKSFSPQGRHRS